MVIEFKDSAGVVVHNKFHEWCKRKPCGMLLSLATKSTHHTGTGRRYPGDPSSLTKKLKVLEDGHIGFPNAGQMIMSDRCGKGVFAAWGIPRRLKVRNFRLAQRALLRHHRQYVLQRK